MNTLTNTWLTGWKIIGRLFLAYVIFQLMTLLLLPLFVVLEDKTLLPLIAAIGFLLAGPFAVVIAARAARICPDLTENDAAEPCARPNGSPATPS